MTNSEQYIKDPRVKFGFAQQLQSGDSAMKNYFKKTNFLYLDYLSLQYFMILLLLYFLINERQGFCGACRREERDVGP
jgi:hypothetical protein